LIIAGQQTRHFIEAVEQYAHLGLRTLCLGWRELKKDEYREWSLMFKEANSTLVDREVKGIYLWLFYVLLLKSSILRLVSLTVESS